MSSASLIPGLLDVVGLLVKASLWLFAIGVAYVALRNRTSAATRHWMWTLAVAGLLALPLLSGSLPSWTVAIPVTSPAVRADAAPARAVFDDESPLLPVAASPKAANAEASLAASVTTATNGLLDRLASSWPVTLVTLYLAGALLLLITLCRQHASARRLAREAETVTDAEWTGLLRDCARQMGVDRPVRLLRCLERAMPMALGVRRPAILIPAVADNWADDRRRAVLLHELAHIARHDCFTQMLASAACAVYWVHPGVWWVARQLRVERELSCDDRVLTIGTEARDYAGHLLEIAYTLGAHRSPALAVSMARPGQLEGRMLAVLDAARNRTVPGASLRLAGLAVALVLVLPLAVIQATTMPLVVGPPHELPPTTSRASDGHEGKVPASSPVAHVEPGEVESPAPAPQDQAPGTWEIRPSGEPGKVQLRMTEGNSSSGRTVSVDQFEGLSALLSGNGGPARFTLRRDAGTFTFEGTIRSGAGAGTYSFAPNPAFAAELEKRGIARPSARQQYELARADVGLALVDELTSQGYTKPTLEQLVKAGNHGVSVEFVREMGALGYKLGDVDRLITMRDHGVTPRYVREMQAVGLTKLTAEELVTGRDHGVTPEFVKGLADLGYTSLSLRQLVTTRDHGVTPEFARAITAEGYPKLPLDELVRVRDHGVTPEFMKAMSEAGYTKLPIDELVNARDHGVTPEFIREMSAAGYAKLPLGELVNARDHGVTPEFTREMIALGYKGLPLQALVRARDHGVTPEYAKQMKGLGYDALSLDELITMRDHGVTPEKARKANEKAGTKLPPDMLRKLADGGW